MLKFQSFKLAESEKINEFLKDNIIASGSSVFVSNGEILIPYEDGEMPNKEQQRLMLKELKNAEIKQIELLVHSQSVMDIQRKGIEEQLANCALITAPKGKEDYDKNKESEKEIKRLENVLEQNKMQVIQNKAEFTRLVNNITVFDERIADLDK